MWMIASRLGVIRPFSFRPDLSAEAINRRLGLEPVSAEVFEQHFRHLPTDDEG